jgi:ADP-heptose:LPS heptosyltransferase
VDFYLRQVGAEEGAIPRLPTAEAGVADPRFAVIHPFSGGRRKNWELARFREVAARLEIPVRWLAGPEEKLEEGERFEDLGTLSDWLSGAALYIGNDSGISHLAAACGVPVVAIFGPTDARVWAPRGRAVRVVEAPGGRLGDLPVETVLEAARYFLR